MAFFHRNMWNVWRTVLEENEKLARARLAAVEVFQQQIADEAKCLRQHKLNVAKKVRTLLLCLSLLCAFLVLFVLNTYSYISIFVLIYTRCCNNSILQANIIINLRVLKQSSMIVVLFLKMFS